MSQDPGLCHKCHQRPAATEDDSKIDDIRLARLAKDSNPAVAHVAAAAIAHERDAAAWDRLAGDRQYADRLEVIRKQAVVSRETAQQLRLVAQDAKAVSHA